MRKLPGWLLPAAAFTVAAILAVLAEGHLVILSRVPAALTIPCSAALNPFCFSETDHKTNIYRIGTVTSADDPGNAVIGGDINFTAEYTIHWSDKTVTTGVVDTFDYLTTNTENTTAAGQGVPTTYSSISATLANLKGQILSTAGTKYNTSTKKVTSVGAIEFREQFKCTLSGVWRALPSCGLTQLGPRNLTITLNGSGTGNGCE